MTFPRFAISGGINTALTYSMYLLLLHYFPYNASYTMSYLAGLAFAYLMNRFYVFKCHQGLKSLILLPLVYLVQYLINMLVIWLWITVIGFAVRLAPLAAMVITVPMTYILSKCIFRHAVLVHS
jgi:putative flippase GtrA